MNTVAELIQWLLTMPQDAVPVINMGLNELANAKPAVKVEPVLAYHQHGIWHEVAFPHLPPLLAIGISTESCIETIRLAQRGLLCLSLHTQIKFHLLLAPAQTPMSSIFAGMAQISSSDDDMLAAEVAK